LGGGISEFVYDEEREVFLDAAGRVVLSRHYADRRLLAVDPYRAHGDIGGASWCKNRL
jgi:hypothetical protein